MAPSLHVVSPCEGLAGLVLALTEDAHHRDESLVGLDVRVRLQTLQETVTRRQMSGEEGRRAPGRASLTPRATNRHDFHSASCCAVGTAMTQHSRALRLLSSALTVLCDHAAFGRRMTFLTSDFPPPLLFLRSTSLFPL